MQGSQHIIQGALRIIKFQVSVHIGAGLVASLEELHMVLRAIFSSLGLLCLSAASYAQTCGGAGPMPSFGFESEETALRSAVYEVEAGWQGRWKHLSESERSKQQEVVIAKINAAYLNRHGDSQRTSGCSDGFGNICPSRSGNHSCASVGLAGPREQHFPITLQNRSNDYPAGVGSGLLP